MSAEITSLTESLYEADYVTVSRVADAPVSPEEVARRVRELRKQMRAAVEELEFERAAEIRDEIKSLEQGAVMAGFETRPATRGEPRRSTGRRDGRRHR